MTLGTLETSVGPRRLAWWSRSSLRTSLGVVSLLIAAIVLYALIRAVDPWNGAARAWASVTAGGDARVLLWLVSLLPGAIILQHGIYLGGSRRKQFLQALGEIDATKREELAELYFGYIPLALRYAVPAGVVTLLCAAAIAALTDPGCYLPWLYVSSGGPAAAPALSAICNAASLPQLPPVWSRQVLSGAALGFLGAYVYTLILLSDRARQRDVTTGVAIWATAMPILGPLMGGVAALLIVSGTGAQEGSFTQYAVFFVAGMLPRQFAQFVQAGVGKMFQNAPQVTLRTLPLTTLRGIGPDVQTRLEEEGIFDVSALAYASPHQLMRTTTYAPRQIVDWIDEALLIVNMPTQWEAIEELGITGAMDLAWYDTSRASIPALAAELKMPVALLDNVVTRLAQDAQIQDLYRLYWDHTGKPPLGSPPAPSLESIVRRFRTGMMQDARDRLVAEVRAIDGVSAADADGDRLIVTTDPAARARVAGSLRGRPELDDERE